MSLIWPDTAAAVVQNQPRLHAFVIGVGDYPHLNGGTGQLAREALGLSQITTPRYTAPAIAEWILTQYRNTLCPLGSLEMLISPSTSIHVRGNGLIPVESAIMSRVESSFNAWFQRVSAHPQNLALFYFCGHGLWTSTQFLLPEDFGDPSVANNWKNCIDFDGMRRGMFTSPAQTQLFFIDACRETPFGILTQTNVSGDPLITGNSLSTISCSSTYYATSSGQKAYGIDKDVTYFGKGLLSCLNGVGSSKKNGKWIVDTYTLSNALGQTMALLGKKYNLPLTCNPAPQGLAVIHEPAQPRVFASVECSSSVANLVAEITMTQVGTTLILKSLPGDKKPLIEEVEAGNWSIDVKFPNGPFPNHPLIQENFMPPVFQGVPVP
jgi:caspase domain-containing protein